jgi:hypothetical protein
MLLLPDRSQMVWVSMAEAALSRIRGQSRPRRRLSTVRTLPPADEVDALGCQRQRLGSRHRSLGDLFSGIYPG